MIVTPIRTRKIIVGDSLKDILTSSLPSLANCSVVVITSKIVSITQGAVAPLTENKEALVRREAQKIFINNSTTKDLENILTITHDMFSPWAGIDESNGNGYYVLLPKNPMNVAEEIWLFLREKYNIKELGVIIADSTFIPLRTGSVSVGIGWCGFEPIKNYIDTPDIFDRNMHYTTRSFVDGLAITAAFTMGEGAEQQPLAVITDIPDITFVNRAPTKEEIASMHYPLEKDLFGPLISGVTWEKGGSK